MERMSASEAYRVSRMSWMAGASTRNEGEGGGGRSLFDGAGEGVREWWKLKCEPEVEYVGVGGG